ncbi:hypothetical protein DHB64_15890 [Antarcticibacterium sp. W02-3]|nr:hypothetical protein [Antarcticibacterium sp. W02-3]
MIRQRLSYQPYSRYDTFPNSPRPTPAHGATPPEAGKSTGIDDLFREFHLVGFTRWAGFSLGTLSQWSTFKPS